MAQEDQTESDIQKQKLARIIAEKKEMSENQKNFFTQFLPLLDAQILATISKNTIQEAFAHLLAEIEEHTEKVTITITPTTSEEV